MRKLTLSPLSHTWILDLDGTLVKHNGYLIDGKDSMLPGAKEFLASIPQNDSIIILTSRDEKYRDKTIKFLNREGICYDAILFNIPYGERIVMNDKKNSGLETAKAVNVERNSACEIEIEIDSKL